MPTEEVARFVGGSGEVGARNCDITENTNTTLDFTDRLPPAYQHNNTTVQFRHQNQNQETSSIIQSGHIVLCWCCRVLCWFYCVYWVLCWFYCVFWCHCGFYSACLVHQVLLYLVDFKGSTVSSRFCPGCTGFVYIMLCSPCLTGFSNVLQKSKSMNMRSVGDPTLPVGGN